MNAQTRKRLISAFAVLVGLVGTIALTTLWHLFVFGDASPPRDARSYAYTQYFTNCLSLPFAAAYFVLSIALGWTVRRGWPVALGMILPLPIAVQIEAAADPTNHNLLPFEVLFYWLPAFGLALLGGYLGKIIRDKARALMEEFARETAPGDHGDHFPH
jgi:hypothetical protein